tara:strand:+ start:130 stop:438 length:309 start_codon:yes stop_codon:yes gene_type:complete
MKITIKYNIAISFALIGYMFLMCPILGDTEAPMLVETLFPDDLILQVTIGIASTVASTIAGMYIIRSLWNRLFPHLCNWKEINLAESYALSIFSTMFLIEWM